MNVHDSERLSGLLEGAGLVRAAGDQLADVVVFNTCAVRENADNKLYGNLGQLAPSKAERPGMQIAVGGCLAQKDRSEILRRAPWVDVVFGTHNVGSLPTLLERSRHNARAELEILEALEVFIGIEAGVALGARRLEQALALVEAEGLGVNFVHLGHRRDHVSAF